MQNYEDDDILAYVYYSVQSDVVEALEGAVPSWYEYQQKVILRNDKIIFRYNW